MLDHRSLPTDRLTLTPLRVPSSLSRLPQPKYPQKRYMSEAPEFTGSLARQAGILHRTCNMIKGNSVKIEELRMDNALNGRLYVNHINELVDLYETQEFAYEHLLLINGPQGFLAA